ncbi:MAG TPA: choice-of-anchor D domain-containing protein, partial [Candidatus Kapabacteria bacterium]|nr:choice-of-anchor D domain-containing protein [Candidatus Kapabacteria bacterium]
MRRALYWLTLISTLGFAQTALGQNWSKLLQLTGTNGSSAFFFNASEGLIGTGWYLFVSTTLATIYYTDDGGATWTQAKLPNPNIVGQVTDIYFHDRLNGWATICETSQTGWSGIYHSTDGGKSWSFVQPAIFPDGIRETSRGVFYTNRDVNPAIMFSSDQGKTWVQNAITGDPTGIDFMDDNTGFVSTQAFNSLDQYLLTTDGGVQWQAIPAGHEVWTAYGDPVTRTFFLANEFNPSRQTSLFKIPISSTIEIPLLSYGDSGISGGIAGSHICQSVIYAQGRSLVNGPRGLVRTVNGGVFWKNVGGPVNRNDTRFGVTGRGAVVFAFDDHGGVWKTMNGGDGTLSPSVLPFVSITSLSSTTKAAVCDSAHVNVLLNYETCDSIQISNVAFLSDSTHELSLGSSSNSFNFFSNIRRDSLDILYKPHEERNFTALVKLTIRQADGYLEDTTFALSFIGLPSHSNTLTFLGTTTSQAIDFDSVSLCAGAARKVTLYNPGCADIFISSINTSAPFHLLSNFKPFVLSAGTERTFLLGDVPLTTTGAQQGMLHVTHGAVTDSLVLTGYAYESDRALSLIADSVTSSLCDSASFTIALRNLACKPFKIISVTTGLPFEVSALPIVDSLRPGESTALHLFFIPQLAGRVTDTVHIAVSYEGSGRYDTTIVITGIGTSGKPDVALSSTSLDFGFVSLCGVVQDTLILTSRGCGNVNIDSISLAGSGFSILRAPRSTLLQGQSDTMIVAFSSQDTGSFSGDLILVTDVGNKSIPLNVTVTDVPGHITLSSSPDLHISTCQSQPFSVSIANGRCDSIHIERVTISGKDSQDFTLDSFIPFGISSSGSATISGTFSPSDSSIRTATITLVLEYSDGSTLDTSFAITGIGIGVPPIEVAFGNIGPTRTLTATVGSVVAIPIDAVTASSFTANEMDLVLQMNTDLLTPIGISSNGLFGSVSGSVTPQVYRDSVVF